MGRRAGVGGCARSRMTIRRLGRKCALGSRGAGAQRRSRELQGGSALAGKSEEGPWDGGDSDGRSPAEGSACRVVVRACREVGGAALANLALRLG